MKLEIAKLIDDACILPDRTIEDEVEILVERSGAGWGASRPNMVTLTLAKRYYEAAKLAEQAEELQKQVKGLQLQNGKLKKRVEHLETEYADVRLRNDEPQ